MKSIANIFTKKNESLILLVVTITMFLVMENYAFIIAGYNYLQSYGLGIMGGLLARVVVKDVYDWYLGE